jgi:hypothetical protein
MITVRRALAVLLSVFTIAATVPLGCRQVLGISSLGDDAVTCDSYCDNITAACTGKNLQYGSRDACMGLCATLPVGTQADPTGNTLACRIHKLSLLGEEGSCAAAGPAGEDPNSSEQCTTGCEMLCTGALQVCPEDFKTKSACMTACEALPICGESFDVPTDSCIPDYGSVQCRIYHLTAATLDPETHCPHVAGMGYCSPTLPACPNSADNCTADAGSSDGG